MKNELIRAFTLIFAAIVTCPIGGMWVGIQYCYYENEGWCGDLSPLFAMFYGCLFAFVSFTLVYGLFSILKWNLKAFNIFVVTTMILGVVGGALYFQNHRRSSLIRACAVGNVDRVAWWLRLGADPNARQTKGPRALHWAVESKSKASVRLLLEKGAKPDLDGDCHLYHPLSLAYFKKDKEMISLLRSYGAHAPCPKTQELLIKKYGFTASEFQWAEGKP